MKKKIGSMLCMLLASFVLLAGCGNSGNSANSASSANSNTPQASPPSSDAVASPSGSAEAAPYGTRKLSTALGEVEVPANPQRIIVNWYIGDVFTLGLKPVAYSGWAQETMPFFDKFEGIPAIEKWEPEELMKYDPDLIITYDPQDFEKLSKIAPVVVVPEGDIKTTERLAFLGEATGRQTEAKNAIQTFESKLAKAKEKLTSDIFRDKTFSILQDWGGDSYGVMYETGSRGGTLLYEYLGLKKPEKLQQLVDSSGKGRDSLSYEVASQYFGDYVLWFLTEGKDSEYAQTDIWKSIPAVRDGHIVEIPGEYVGLFYYSDVMSMTAQLDHIMDKLLALSK